MQIKVKVYPKSKITRIEKGALGILQVHVQAPAADGQANQAVRRALAGYFGLKPYQVCLVRGQKSRIKIFDVEK